MFKYKLERIEETLVKYEDIDMQELYKNCINNKLQNALAMYLDEVELKSDFLATRDSARVLKALAKIQKNNDKEVIKEKKHKDE